MTLTIANGIANSRTWGSRELDPATGLPLVGEDEFWRLVSGGVGQHYNYLELRRWKTPTALMKLITKRRASVLIKSAPIRKRACSGINVLDTALFVLYKIEEEQAEEIVGGLSVQLGDYPDLRIEV